MNDEEYNNLVDLIVRRLYPQGMDKIRKDGLRRKSKRFLVKDGLLFYYDKKKKHGSASSSKKSKNYHSRRLSFGNSWWWTLWSR